MIRENSEERASVSKGWRRMTFKERDMLLRERHIKFAVRCYRCHYCQIVVDERSRVGHLVYRCDEVIRLEITFIDGLVLDDHFDYVGNS